VHPLERAEEVVRLAHLEAGAVVTHEEDALPDAVGLADLDARGGASAVTPRPA